MVMNRTSEDRLVAVLIDDENVGLGSVQWLFDQVSNLGRILVRRAYSDWSKGGNQRDQLLQLGIEPVHVFQTSGAGKNASDIRLAIDAIDLLFSSPVDTFVVVSGDADFLPLVNKLRASGKMVVGAGRQKSVSATLVKACDRYYYLDQHEQRQEIAKPQPRQTRSDSLLVRAVRASMDAEGKVLGSQLHQTMQRLDPGFDFRSRGYSSFTAFLEASSEVKVTRPSAQGDVVIELTEQDIDGAPKKSDDALASIASKIDDAWAERASSPDKPIPGPSAAGDAAKVLDIPKLSGSKYKSLQGLLDAVPGLARNWRRDGNQIYRR